MGFRRLISTMASMSSLDSPLGPGFRLRLCEKSAWYFPFLKTRWMLNSVEGFSTIAERIKREDFMNKVHTPAMKRSEALRFGALFRARLRISSCCLRRMDSAITERVPPGRHRRQMAKMTWTKRIIRSCIPAFYQERQELEMLRENIAGWHN